MTGKRKHPGYTGVAAPFCWELSATQREALATNFRGFCSSDQAWDGFRADVEASVRWYLQIKEVAEKSSAASARGNLSAARDAAKRLLKSVNDLDGNSMALLAEEIGHRNIKDATKEITAALIRASLKWDEKFPPGRGPRPRPERVQMAARVLAAMRRFTIVKATATEGKLFERLLKLAFGFADEKRKDLHRLAGRALAGAVTLKEEPGMLFISAPNDE